MDRLTQHNEIVRQLVEAIAQITPSDEKSETQLIMDHERGHYLLFSVGWGNNRREYIPFVHLDVRPNAKVYIQHDGTDLQITERLVEEGIGKQAIVLAFQAPGRRKLIPDFAAIYKYGHLYCAQYISAHFTIQLKKQTPKSG